MQKISPLSKQIESLPGIHLDSCSGLVFIRRTPSGWPQWQRNDRAASVTLVANGSAQQPSSMPLRPVSAGRRVEERHWQPVARTHLPHPQGRAGTCRTRVLAGVLECVCWCSGVLNMT